MDMQKEIRTLQDKANRYDNIKGRYVEHAQKLKNIIEQAQQLLKEIDPVLSIKESRGYNSNIKEITAEVYEKLRAGTEIRMDFLEKAYPELNYQQRYHIIAEISKKKDVGARKEGRTRIIYAKKEI